MIFAISLLIAIALTATTLHFLIAEKKEGKNYYKDKGSFLKRLIKQEWYTLADDYMKEAGYPISTEIFLTLNMVVLVFAAYSSLESLMLGEISRVITNALRLIIFTLLPLNLYIGQRRKNRQNKLRLELCNIQDIMYFQSKIGTPLEVILTYAARAAGTPLREALQFIANAPKVKKSLEEALENFRSVSSITEIQAFSFALAQRHEMGITEKNFEAQSNMLKRSKRLRRKIIRHYKRTKLLVAAFLLFVCYALMVTVPILQEIMRNLDIIFR